MTSHLEQKRKDNRDSVVQATKTILGALGEDLTREGLRDTPKRVADSLIELTSGHCLTASDVVSDAIFPCDAQGMILQKDIEFYSLCEHHLLPFFGNIHVAYIPNGKIIGLSKMGRLIDIFSKRLQVQEHLTHQIAHAVESLLKPHGVAVIVEAQHFCMMMRGVKKQGSTTLTSHFSGQFESDHHMRSDFLRITKK